jgi:hypothetical protein
MVWSEIQCQDLNFISSQLVGQSIILLTLKVHYKNESTFFEKTLYMCINNQVVNLDLIDIMANWQI